MEIDVHYVNTVLMLMSKFRQAKLERLMYK